MKIYGNDFNDLFPPNPDSGTTTPGHLWAGGNAAVGGAGQEFNPDILDDPKTSLLAPFTAVNHNSSNAGRQAHGQLPGPRTEKRGRRFRRLGRSR